MIQNIFRVKKVSCSNFSPKRWNGFIIYLVAIILNPVSFAFAQVSEAEFDTLRTTYTEISGGTVLGNNDDTPYPNIPLGFNFNFNGTDYNTVTISPNGYIVAGNSSTPESLPISNVDNSISAFGVDLVPGSAPLNDPSKTPEIRWMIQGSAPTRIFTVQWRNYRNKGGNINNRFNFQIKIYESEFSEFSANRVEFVYGTSQVSYGVFEAQVGVRGNSPDDFYNWRSNQDFSKSEWKYIEKGELINDVCNIGLLVGALPVYPPSGFTFSYSESIIKLPVVLNNFSGKFENNAVKLQWTTIREENNDRFEIERSGDGKDFNSIGEVKGNANSTSNINYQFIDRDIYGEGYYYRLKQIDFNGDYHYSKIIFIQTQSKNALSVKFYPNPAQNDNIGFSINSPVQQDFTVQIISPEGKILLNKKFSGKDLNSYLLLEKQPELTPKTYYLKTTQGSQTAIHPLIIVQ